MSLKYKKENRKVKMKAQKKEVLQMRVKNLWKIGPPKKKNKGEQATLQLRKTLISTSWDWHEWRGGRSSN